MSGIRPLTGSKPKDCAGLSGWSVVVSELDMLIELVPFLFPAPYGTAMYATAIGDNLKGSSL